MGIVLNFSITPPGPRFHSTRPLIHRTPSRSPLKLGSIRRATKPAPDKPRSITDILWEPIGKVGLFSSGGRIPATRQAIQAWDGISECIMVLAATPRLIYRVWRLIRLANG